MYSQHATLIGEDSLVFSNESSDSPASPIIWAAKSTMSTDRPNSDGLPSECPPPIDRAGHEGPLHCPLPPPTEPAPPGVPRPKGKRAGGGAMLPAPPLDVNPPGISIAPPSLGSTTASCEAEFDSVPALAWARHAG